MNAFTGTDGCALDPAEPGAGREESSVLIIGGGISGLALATALRHRGISTVVWESAAQSGGKIRTTRVGGYRVERSATILLNYRDQITDFLTRAELYAARQQCAANAIRYIARGDSLIPAPGNLCELFSSSLLSPRAKLRLLLEPFIASNAGVSETAYDFVRRRFGEEVYALAFGPYIAGPLASDGEFAEARAVLPKLTGLERRWGSVSLGVLASLFAGRRAAFKAEGFSFRHGMQTLTRELANSLGNALLTNTRAKGVEPCADGWRAVGESPRGRVIHHCRKLVLCTPAPNAAALLHPVDPRAHALLAGIRYSRVAVVNLGFARGALRHPLNGHGYLVAADNRASALTGSLWMSSLFPDRAPADKALLCNYMGGGRHPEAVDLSDQGLFDRTLSALRPHLVPTGDPEFAHIHRHAQALPLYHGAYLRRLQKLDARLARLPGLHLEANYRGGVSVRERIVRAQSLAAKIAAETGTTTLAAGTIHLAEQT